MNVFEEWEAERLAAMNTPEALAAEAKADAEREKRWSKPCDGCAKSKRDCECPEPVEEPEPTSCEMCGDDLNDGICPSCDE